MMKKIVIIIPVYKAEKYIRRCIESILSQSYSNFEIILIDDGSPDDCPTICDQYEKRDSRIVVFHQLNGGTAKARNTGLNYAYGKNEWDYLMFIDSDDYLSENCLEELLSLNERNNTEVSVCDACIVSDKGSLDKKIYTEETKIMKGLDFYANMKIRFKVVPWGKLFHRDIFENIRFPEGVLYEDAFVLWKVFYKAQRISYLDKPLYFYYQSEGSAQRSEYSKEKLVELEAWKEQFDFFSQQEYQGVLHYVGKRLAAESCNHLRELEKLPDRKVYIKLKKFLRMFLLYNSKKCGLSISEDTWIFETAYPRIMRIYWILKACKNKLYGILEC